jgi:hypothetical protein
LIAALYVETNGVYYGLDGVDPWDEARDARLYAGPWPVVAHPPCERWCQLAPLNQSIHGYVVGDDGGCFEAALNAVRTYGGVIEHPALSYAWDAFQLPRPGTHGWTTAIGDDGVTTEVAQVAYGHEARKRTWLYAVGCDLPSLRWNEPPASKQVSAFGTTRGKSRWTRADSLVEGQSRFTPVEFRDVLLTMARSCTSREATQLAS